MLFSNEEVAEFLNANFELVRESVADVPKLQIDFGNGNVIKRSFRGDIATYVCNSDGIVLDVLPGIYDSESYVQLLKQILKDTRLPSGELSDQLTAYHRARLQHVASSGLVAIVPDEFRNAARKVDGQLNSPLDYERHGLLAMDAQNNQAVGRPMIHEHLATVGSVRPSELQNWIYRELFHIDLTDPFLGMKAEFERNYPFEK